MKKRSWVIIILFAIITIGIAIPICFATDEVPIIDESSISLSITNATIGDEIKISMKISGVENAKDIQLHYQQPITKKDIFFGYLTYNTESDRYEATAKVNNGFESGVFRISFVGFSINGNYVFINNSKTNQYGYNKQNLEMGDFTVYGTDADVIKPTIDTDSLQISQNNVEIGDKITISVKVTDDVAMPSDNYIFICYQKPQSVDTELYTVYYNSINDCYEKTFLINDSLEPGLWRINYIAAYDNVQNYECIYNSILNPLQNNTVNLSAGDFTVKADSNEFKAELATIAELDGIQVYTETTTISNTTINGDVYIGPEAIVTLKNVTVNGDIYVLGVLKLSSVSVNTIHAKTMQWNSSGTYSYTNGMYTISGSNSISSSECSNYPVTYIPYKLNRDSISITDGKLHINGVTLDVADFYINDTKINTARGGKFIADNIDLGDSNIITLKWVTVFGNTITKTYCVEDILGDVNLDGKVNITDVALINAHVKKTKMLIGDELKNADVNGDEKINITDVALVNAHVKKVKSLPTSKTGNE